MLTPLMFETQTTAVKTALANNGWQVADKPLALRLGKHSFTADLTAVGMLPGDNVQTKIAVKIVSENVDFTVENAATILGDYAMTHFILTGLEPDRKLVLAFSETFYKQLQTDALGEFLLNRFDLDYLVCNVEVPKVVYWNIAISL